MVMGNADKLREVVNSLEYHSAENKVEHFEALRKAAIEFAGVINEHSVSSREQSLAYTHLEETLMWAVKSVAIRD